MHCLDPLRKLTVLYFFLHVNVNLEAFLGGVFVSRIIHVVAIIQLELLILKIIIITPGG